MGEELLPIVCLMFYAFEVKIKGKKGQFDYIIS